VNEALALPPSPEAGPGADPAAAATSLLIVAADPVVRQRAADAAVSLDPPLCPLEATGLAEARQHLAGGGIRAVLLGWRLADGSALTLADAIAGAAEAVAGGIVMLGEPATLEEERAARTLGLFEVLDPASLDAAALERALAAAAARRQLVRERDHARTALIAATKAAEGDGFVGLLAHDLHAPITTIAGFTRLIERRHGTSLSPEVAELFGFIKEGTRRMQRLVNALRDHAGAEDALAPEAVALDEVAGSVLAELESVIEEAGARVELGPLPEVTGTAAQLRQLLKHLLANALHYRAPERSPHITVAAEAVAAGWRVSVRDNGIGVAPEDRTRIFSRLDRGSRMDRHSAAGLGLATCRRIVERHGGGIGVEDSPGGGATFWFTLPTPLGNGPGLGG